ncbi:16958_t:CDS:2, partial [Rhizophagus irregularis]
LQNKKILLLIDNVPSHFDLNYYLPEDEIEDLESTNTRTSYDEVANINQIIRELNVTEDPHGAILANAINDYFLDLEKEIPIEDVLNNNDI